MEKNDLKNKTVALDYRVCHGFRLTKRDDYFWVTFDHFWSKHHFFEAAGALVEISSSLQSSNHNQVKLAQIRETHCRPLSHKNYFTNAIEAA